MPIRTYEVTEPILTNIERLVREYRVNLQRCILENPELHTDIDLMADDYRSELFRHVALNTINSASA